uniref:TolC family protein n=1 Tax=Desulfobacca acetoxidans TaxID=60893 RepID=A0A7C3Z407_9BACT
MKKQGISTLTAALRHRLPQLRLPHLTSLLWFFFLLCFNLPLRAQEQAGLPADLKALLAEAVAANPAIKEKAQMKAASKEAIRPAGALDNPELMVGLLNIPTNTWAFNQQDMTMQEVALSQKFPFPGKRRLRSEVAEEQSRADGFSHQDKINEIRTKVIQGYWALSLAYASYDITRKNKELWDQVVQVAETRYAVGQGLQADVLQAQVEVGNYLDRLFQWQQAQESLRADLNALRSKPPGAPIARPQPLKPRPLNLKLENLLKLAAEQPQLQALKAQVAKQEKAVALARKEFFPDFGVGVAYGCRENQPGVTRPDFFSATFSLSLPLWREGKIKPKIREQQALQAAAQDAHQSSWDRIAAAVKDRFATLQRVSEQVQLYSQGIIPQADQAAQASLAAYQTGTLDFARLTQNFIALYRAELKFQEYLKDFEGAWAELEWLVGQELPRAGAAK